MGKDGRARGVKWVKKQAFFRFKACKAYGTRLKRKGGHLEKVSRVETQKDSTRLQASMGGMYGEMKEVRLSTVTTVNDLCIQFYNYLISFQGGYPTAEDYGPDLLPGKIKKNKAQARDHVS